MTGEGVAPAAARQTVWLPPCQASRNQPPWYSRNGPTPTQSHQLDIGQMRDVNWDTALTLDTIELQSNRQTVCGLMRDHADLAPATARKRSWLSRPKARGNVCAAPRCYIEVSETRQGG